MLSVAASLDDAHAIGEECKQRGLAVPSAYGGDIPLDSVEAGVGGMYKLIDNCAAAGVADLMMGGVATPEQAAVYYKAIGEACPHATEKGVGISVKPHGGTYPNGRKCRRIVEEVN